MTEPRPRKRLARTRRALRAALIDLLRTRDYDDLKVHDVLQAADVGRSTFYAHFSSKDELLRFGLQSLGEEVRAAAERAGEPERRFAFLRPLLEHIEGHRELFRHLKGRGAEVHRQAMDQILADLIRGEIGSREEGFDPVRELEVQFVKGALFAVILWWVERNSSLGPGEVEAELLRLIGGGRSFGA